MGQPGTAHLAREGGAGDAPADVVRLHGRVARVEGSVDQLAEALVRVERQHRDDSARLERKVDDQGKAINAKLDQLVGGLTQTARTNWGALASWAGVVLAVVGGIGAAWVGPLVAADRAHERDLVRAEARAAEDRALTVRTFEMAVRAEERQRAAGKAGAP